LLGGSKRLPNRRRPGLTNGEVTGGRLAGRLKSTDGGQRVEEHAGPPAIRRISPQSASPRRSKGIRRAPIRWFRAGTNGLFYYAGLVFDRGDSGRSAIFVARFVDNNNRENGDPVAYLGTKIVAAKTRGRGFSTSLAGGRHPARRRTCTIPAPAGGTLRIPAGPAYATWTAITGSGSSLRSQILLARSVDCGVTWSTPVVLSRSQDPINQGSTIAIDPRTGALMVAWRSFASPGGSDADTIVSARSIDFGRHFDPPFECHRFSALRARDAAPALGVRTPRQGQRPRRRR